MTNLRQCSEKQLIDCIREGNHHSKEASDVLFSRYLGRAISLIDRWGGEQDIVQEAFLDAWFALSTPDHECHNFGGYLYATLRNRFIDACRTAQKEPITIPLEYCEGQEPSEDIKEFVSTSPWELWLIVRNELQKLPYAQREAVHRRILDGMTYNEIAECLGVSYPNVHRNVKLGLKRLRELLSDRPEIIEMLGGLTTRKRPKILEG